MRNRMGMLAFVVMTASGFVAGLLVESRMQRVQAQVRPESAFPAVPGEKGGEDITGPYERVADWPKPLTSLPGNEGWTWGVVEGIFAESPDRVFIAERGELPVVKRPVHTPIPAVWSEPFLPDRRGAVPQCVARAGGQFAGRRRPRRFARGCGQEMERQEWASTRAGRHALVVVDASGKISEGLDEVGQFFRAPARRVHQSLRPGEKRLGRRRL